MRICVFVGTMSTRERDRGMGRVQTSPDLGTNRAVAGPSTPKSRTPLNATGLGRTRYGSGFARRLPATFQRELDQD